MHPPNLLQQITRKNFFPHKKSAEELTRKKLLRLLKKTMKFNVNIDVV